MHAEHLKKFTLLPPVPALLVGILLLTLGRKLFWLFVAAIGFIVGSALATPMFPQNPDWVFAAAVGFGILGALLAILVQKVAVSVGGYLAGGYFLMTLVRSWGEQGPAYSWISFVIGGFIGAALMIYVFKWALIIFSSISGAHLIARAFPSEGDAATAIFLALVVVGCIVQGRALTPRKTGGS